jgi:molecular chaperone DnaJ
VTKKRRLTVAIPDGMHDGQVLRVRGEGEPGDKGRRGDLHVLVRVKPHPFLMRHGNDLVMDLPISFTQAALGCTIEVPTLSKKNVSVEIPNGTQSGDLIRLKNMGLPDLRSKKHGELIIRAMVEIPKKLSDHQRKILEQFAETEKRNQDAMPSSYSFWDKIKQYFSTQNNSKG